MGFNKCTPFVMSSAALSVSFRDGAY